MIIGPSLSDAQPPPSPATGRRLSPDAASLILIAAVGVAVRLVPAIAARWISNDAVEYLDIARRLAEGKGFTLSIKAYHYVQGPLIHYAGWDRAFLFPALLSLVWRVAPSQIALQLANLVFGAAGALLGYGVARSAYGSRAGLGVGLLLATAPRLVCSSWYLWTEPLALALTLGAAWAFISGESPRRMALAGLLQGAAFLARPASTAALVLMCLFLVFRHDSWRTRAVRLAALCGGFVLAASVQLGLNLAYGAPPFTTPQAFLYRTMSFGDGMYYRYGEHWAGSASETFREHRAEIVRAVRTNAGEYAKFLLRGREGVEWLWLLAAALPLYLTRLALGRLTRPQLFLGLSGLMALFFHTLTWSTRDPERFLQIPYGFLLAICVGEALRGVDFLSRRLPKARRWGSIAVGLVVVWMMALYLRPSIRDAREAVRRHGSDWPMMGIFSANWRNDDALALHEWIRRNTSPDSALAATNPWALAYHTGRPAVAMPFDLDERTLPRFLEDFGVEFVIFNFKHPQPVYKKEADYRELLGRSGVPAPVQIGSYWIYALHPAAAASSGPV